MTKKERAELHDILRGIDTKLSVVGTEVSAIKDELKSVKKNQIVLNSRQDSFDQALTNVGVVCAETQRFVQQLHGNMISTTDKQGKRIRRLELVKNGEPTSGGRRPARKNS